MSGTPPLTPVFNEARGYNFTTHVERAERVLSRCEAHFEKHQAKWISDRYNKLLLNEAPAPALRPSWAHDDRKSHLYRAAGFLVQRSQQKRIERIKRIGLGLEGPGYFIGR